VVADVDLGWSGVSRGSTVGQVDSPFLFRVFIGGCSCLWVCFGLLEGYALWFQCVEVIEYSLEEGEFGGEFGAFGGDVIDDDGDGSAVRVNGVITLLRVPCGRVGI
jgi:hypothetical protein